MGTSAINVAGNNKDLPLGKGNDTAATGDWWKKEFKGKSKWMDLMVPRDQVIGFAVYTAFDETLKLTAQSRFQNEGC